MAATASSRRTRSSRSVCRWRAPVCEFLLLVRTNSFLRDPCSLGARPSQPVADGPPGRQASASAGPRALHGRSPGRARLSSRAPACA